MKAINSKVAFLTIAVALLFCMRLPCGHIKAGAAQSAKSVYPDLCSAPRLSIDEENSSVRAANVEEATISTVEDIAIVLEYDSVYSVHTAINPALPLRSQAGSFNATTIFSDLERSVDPTKYDFVLMYSLAEVPGWIHSGARGIQSSAKNIGLANSLFGLTPTYPKWTRLRAAPHMNSIQFIDTDNEWYPGYGGTYTALHEMAHHWNVYWAQASPGPRGWKRGDPVAWLAAASGHWSYVWEPQEAAGIMYSGALSERFTDLDLYAMGLMGYAEASQTTYQVHEDTQPASNSVHYNLKLDDLIASLSRAGGTVFEGNGHRVPDTDKASKRLNTLIVVVKGRDEVITEQQKNLIVALANDIPAKWSIATKGRSQMVVAGVAEHPPSITHIEREGKHVVVHGEGFDPDSVILINGVQKKTVHDSDDPTRRLVGKKLIKQISSGETVTIQVRNADGQLSNSVTFTRN